MSSRLPTQEEILSEKFSDEDILVPDWHLAIIEERMARYQTEDTEWTPLEEFEKEIEDFRNSLTV